MNVFPEIKAQLLNIFERYRHVLDPELQQRACEYYALASRPEEDEMLQNVCEEMPPFPPRVSALLGRLNRKHGDTEDKRTWIHGGKEANLEREVVLQRGASQRKPPTDDTLAKATSSPSSNDILDSLAGLDLSIPPKPAESLSSSTPPRVTVAPSIDEWFEKLMSVSEGILYEDIQIQVGIKSRYQGHMGQLAIYVGNKISVPLTSFTTTTHIEEFDALSLSFAKMPPTSIAPRAQVQQLLHLDCKKMFKKPPILTISYLTGSHQTISLRLPITITKFFEPIKLEQAQFFERWKLIGGPPRESQTIFNIVLTAANQLDLEKNKKVVSGHHFAILEDVDPNLNNIVGAGILHTSAEGKVGCLLRLEPNREQKVILLLLLL